MDKYACVGCHVPGTPLAAKWAELGARYTVADLTAFFLAPTPPMPVFPLTEAERRQLAIHLLDPG
jgi:mono/diheme cytochrome c family protein